MIIVIHENKEWMPPFEKAFKELNIEYSFWYMPEMSINFSDQPPAAVFYNRMSASSHSRGHRFEPEITIGVLSWLERHKRIVVNGSRALDLEISKLRQYQELEKHNIRTPRTFATINKKDLLDGANEIGFPLITKHNRAGKGLGVYRFENLSELANHLESEMFEDSPDGITLIQEYINAPSNTITRMEFIGGKFLYAVEVDTTQGFKLCPADDCSVDTVSPKGDFSKFKVLNNFSLPNMDDYESFLATNSIGVAGIEIIIDSNNVAWTYDVNTNTNYNAEAEHAANQSAPQSLVKYLQSLVIRTGNNNKVVSFLNY
ncbi:uncharacterized protein METZ01_LOCUS186732 [marine metagenome]|uniref:ATP-grasp domain-containing protein n=1 Tax=marine metagenome TaxID=408172 RepID=A0A382D613_9ZZZZ